MKSCRNKASERRDMGFAGHRRSVLLLVLVGVLGAAAAQSAEGDALPPSAPATGAQTEGLASLKVQEQLERLLRENAALKAQLAAQRQSSNAGTGELSALEQRLAAVTVEQKNLISQVALVAEQHAMILGSSAPAESHVVIAGDTLSGLAQTYLGSGDLWPELLEANPDLTNADQLLPGTRLTLPHND